MKVSLVIPAYNEEKAIKKVVDEALDYVDEIIVVDDGSKDDTARVVRANFSKNRKVKLILHDKNQGKADALRTGIKSSKGDIIILTDADYTYPASAFPEMIKKLEEGADLVLGNRFKSNMAMPSLNKLGNTMFSLIATYITCVNINDGQTGLRAFRRDMFDDLDVNAKNLEYETKMTVKAAKLGYKIDEVPIEYRPRIGQSKLSPFKDGMKMFSSLVSIAFSETSLLAKAIMMPSLLFILIGLLTGISSWIEYLNLGAPKHPYYPLITVFAFLIAIQLFSLGLLTDNLTKKLSRIEERMIKNKGTPLINP
jgi:glycosyltransferase involved in cell wall biosynthesis